jgi:hypothetical protein
MAGLPAGDYYLQANHMNQSNWVNEWWASGGSSLDCGAAEQVSVSSGVDTEFTDFQLDLGISISGTLYQSDGTTEVTDVSIHVSALIGDPCGFHQWIGWAQTNPTVSGGAYEIRGMPTGTEITLRAENNNQSDYVNVFRASGGTTYHCNDAESFLVSTTPITGKDFQLERGGSISGNVTGIDGTPSGTLLENVWVHLSLEPCGGMLWGVGGSTDADGYYHIRGVPAGTGNVYVQSCAHCGGQNYVDEWWDGVPDCSQADQVTVAQDVETASINFTLEQGGSVSGQVTELDGFTPIENLHVYAVDFDTHTWQHQR